MLAARRGSSGVGNMVLSQNAGVGVGVVKSKQVELDERE